MAHSISSGKPLYPSTSIKKMKRPLFIIALSLIIIQTSAQNIHRTACQGNLIRLDSMLTNTSIQVKDFRGRSLLHWAVACKQKEVFDFLIEKGANVNAEDNQKKIPMHIAVHYGNETYFDLLVGLQPDNQWVSSYGPSLLEKAVMMKRDKLIKKLIAKGVDINSTNERGSTGLEIAQRMDADEIAQVLLSLGADQNLVRTFDMKGDYMGEKKPGLKPKLFAPNFISTEEQEFSCTFNAAGTEFYFGVDNNGKSEIRYSTRVGNTWSKPKIFLIHDRYGYNDPFFSNDGNRLYFISKQALDGAGEPKDVDIWYVEKGENGWSEPINAGTNINTEGNEYYISFTADGTMYFSSNGHAENENRSDHDIYYSKYINGEFQKPVALGNEINTEDYEADVFIAPDESYIIFCSSREGGKGQGDLYVSFRHSNGSWTQAVNMGEAINSQNYEYCPVVTHDGKYLFYTSNQDIYWVSTEILDEIKKDHGK